MKKIYKVLEKLSTDTPKGAYREFDSDHHTTKTRLARKQIEEVKVVKAPSKGTRKKK